METCCICLASCREPSRPLTEAKMIKQRQLSFVDPFCTVTELPLLARIVYAFVSRNMNEC